MHILVMTVTLKHTLFLRFHGEERHSLPISRRKDSNGSDSSMLPPSSRSLILLQCIPDHVRRKALRHQVRVLNHEMFKIVIRVDVSLFSMQIKAFMLLALCTCAGSGLYAMQIGIRMGIKFSGDQCQD